MQPDGSKTSLKEHNRQGILSTSCFSGSRVQFFVSPLGDTRKKKSLKMAEARRCVTVIDLALFFFSKASKQVFQFTLSSLNYFVRETRSFLLARILCRKTPSSKEWNVTGYFVFKGKLSLFCSASVIVVPVSIFVVASKPISPLAPCTWDWPEFMHLTLNPIDFVSCQGLLGISHNGVSARSQ